MSVEIVLLQPPGWGVENPPLGLAMLKAYLQERGVSCRIMDLNIQLFHLRHVKYGDSWNLSYGYSLWNNREFVTGFFKEYQHEIEHFVWSVIQQRPGYIGLSVHGSSYLSAIAIADLLHRYAPSIPQIYGGPQMARGRPEWRQILTNRDDFVIFGEGEESLLEIVKGGAQVQGTATLAYDGGLRPQIKNLDELPFPDFRDFYLPLYNQQDFLPTYFSRGCLNHCAYCTESVYFPGFRCRNGERVFNEICHLMEAYPRVGTYRFHDSVSNGNIRELERLCDLLIENDVQIQFNLEGAVIRREMDARLYRKLKKAGCALIGYGLETPSKQLLANIGKTVSRDADIRKVVTDGVKSGITIGLNFMFGLPGETDADSMQQIELIKKIPWYRRHRVIINPALTLCAISPGCRAHDEPEKYGIDLEKGEYLWESRDKANTFEIRRFRFNRFVAEATALGYRNLFDVNIFPGVDGGSGQRADLSSYPVDRDGLRSAIRDERVSSLLSRYMHLIEARYEPYAPFSWHPSRLKKWLKYTVQKIRGQDKLYPAVILALKELEDRMDTL